MKMEYIIS